MSSLEGLPERPRSSDDHRAILAAILFFLAVAVFGARYHWVEEAGTAERDGYAAKASELLRGEIPRDPYRPLLYPLATAALTPVAGDPFDAARLLSNAAAAVLVGLAYFFGSRLGDRRSGAWAMALAMVNPNLWILGQHASTDMLFAALAAAALAGGLAYLEAPSARAAGFAGLALGLASFTRSNAVFLFPGLLLAAVLARPTAGRRRPSHAVLFALAWLAGLMPHGYLRYRAFGDPFHDENWKNLAFKLYGYPDWSYLDRVPFASLGEVVRAAPAKVVSGAFGELGRFATSGGAQLLGTPLHLALFLAGSAWALWAIRERRRPTLYLLGAMAVFLLALAATFFTWGRLLLFTLPPAYGIAFLPWRRAGRWEGSRTAQRLLAVAGIVLVAVLAAKTFAFRLPAFVARHPYAEVATLEGLDRRLPSGAALAGSPPFLGRYLDHSYVELPDAFGEETARPELYFARIRPLLRQEKVEYLVVGQEDLRDRPAALVGQEPPVAWLEPVGGRAGIAVWRVRRDRL
jgi:hypothetical protein